MDNDNGRAKEKGIGQRYADPSIAAKQRALVDRQLAAMKDGLAPEHFAVVGMVLNRIRRDEGREQLTLLDAGCGSAYYSEVIDYFEPGMIDYTGCDYNPGMVALAKERYPNLPIYECDLRNLNQFNDGQFDIVLSGAAIIHIREWRKVVRELCRVADKWLILHRTWVHVDGTPTMREMRDAYGQQVWYHTFNEAELVKQVRDLDFDLLDRYPTGEGIKHGRVLTYLFRRLARATSNRAGVLQSTGTPEPSLVGAAAA